MAIHKVNLGPRTIDVEVFDIPGGDGKTVLITGGMDGDEYTGKEAAYQLKERYAGTNNPGRLIIIPCVNIPGFEAGVSRNPLDKKFPKFVYPGKSHGSPTERLVAWLTGYVKHTDVWIDLHAGATHESLTPHVMSSETSYHQVNMLTCSLLSALDVTDMIYLKKGTWNKVEMLGKDGVSYLMFESGGEGSTAESDILRHVGWVEQVFTRLWKKEETEPVTEQKMPFVYRTMSFIQAPDIGYFSPVKTCNDEVLKGDILGYLLSHDKKRTRTIQSPADGKILWNSVALEVGKTDEIFGIASA